MEPRVKDVKKWVYKDINGKWYRRLFNVTTGKYETDWISYNKRPKLQLMILCDQKAGRRKLLSVFVCRCE